MMTFPARPIWLENAKALKRLKFERPEGPAISDVIPSQLQGDRRGCWHFLYGLLTTLLPIGVHYLPQRVIESMFAEQLEKRASFRRTMKMAIQRSMEGGAKGIRLQLSGRLGGAEMARCEKGMDGSIPLSTLRAKVDYGFAEASTPQGNIGIKVWVNNGDYLTGEINDATDAQAGQVQKKSARRRKG